MKTEKLCVYEKWKYCVYRKWKDYVYEMTTCYRRDKLKDLHVINRQQGFRES